MILKLYRWADVLVYVNIVKKTFALQVARDVDSISWCHARVILQALEKKGFLESERVGRRLYYSITKDGLELCKYLVYISERIK